MKITKTILFILNFAFIMTSLNSCSGQTKKQVLAENNMDENQQDLPYGDIEKMYEIANADRGKGYQLGDYRIYPEKKVICTQRMYGTEVKDCIGYFPNPSLRYEEDTLIIFGGAAFFDKSGLNIDWKTARLLWSAEEYAKFSFADEQNWYTFYHGDIVKQNGPPENFYAVETPLKETPGRKVLTVDFYISRGTFYFDNLPIMESFDIKKLRVITSASGFKTDFITDGKQVIYGGERTGYQVIEKNGKEYALVEELMVKGIDFASLRVLGKSILADKNALYYQTEVIPFAALKGFKLLIREM